MSLSAEGNIEKSFESENFTRGKSSYSKAFVFPECGQQQNQMSIALGNKKPQQLLEVEKLIWHALFTLSEGATAPEDILGDLVVQIPWQTLQPPLLAISKQDAEWFMIDDIPLSASPVQKNLPLPSTLLTSTSLPSPVRLPTTTPPPDNDNNNAMTETFPRQGCLPTTTPPPDINAMDESLDYQNQQQSISFNPPLSMEPDNSAHGDRTASSLPNNNNDMDESLDYSPQPPNTNSAQDTGAGSSEVQADQGFIAMNQDTPADGAAETEAGRSEVPADQGITAMNLDTPTDGAAETEAGDSEVPADQEFTAMNQDIPTDGAAEMEAGSSEVPADQGFTAMNQDTPTDGAAKNKEDDNRTQGSSYMSDSEKSLEARPSRRSTRLALEKRKDDSLGRDNTETSSRSTSPVEPSLPKRQYQPTTRVKRKAPTGDAVVKNLLSTGGSSDSPIDVDALQAVLQRFPLKREPQVCRR